MGLELGQECDSNDIVLVGLQVLGGEGEEKDLCAGPRS